MNGAHLHLIVNHLPVVSVLFAIAFLLVGVVRRSDGLMKIGLIISVVVGLTGAAAFLTGEGAEDVLEQWPGADRQLIHEHEETAETAFIASVVLGILGLAGLALAGKKPMIKKTAPIVALILAIATGVLMAQAANEGGDIRHPEIRDGAVAPVGPGVQPGTETEGDD